MILDAPFGTPYRRSTGFDTDTASSGKLSNASAKLTMGFQNATFMSTLVRAPRKSLRDLFAR